MQLKNVVLPAPLGPMTLTMAPWSSAKSSPWIASSPPNRLVAPSTSSNATTSAAFGRGLAGCEDGRLGFVRRRVQLVTADARRHQALGAVAHHDDERKAVEQKAVLGELAEQLRQADE